MSGARKKFGIFKILAIVVVVLLAAIIALPFILDVDRFRPQLESKLSSAIGREVKLGKLQVSIISGGLAVKDISIADSPVFNRYPFVSAKSLRAEIALKPLIFSKSVHIQGITLDHPSIILVSSKSGKWNFSDFGSGETGSKPASGKSGSFDPTHISVKQLKIVDGQVTVIHAENRRKPSVYSQVNFTASNLSYSTAFPFSLTASLPGQGTLKLEGKAGPLDERDLWMTPMNAEIEVKRFDPVVSGFMGTESGLAGLFDFSGTLNSDGTGLRSNGQASADRLQIVKNGSPSGKPVSLQYALDYNPVRRNGTLKDARIGSGKAIAHLNGTYEMRESDLFLNLSLQGTGMPVQDLTELLPALGITLPKGASLQGGVLNTKLVAEGPVERMIIAGTAEIYKTRLVGFDLSGKMAAVATLAGLRPSRDTEIEKFSSGLRMTPDGLQVSKLQLIVPGLGELAGDGRIASDQTLDFTVRAMLTPGGAIGAGLSRIVKGGTLNIPCFIRGTASDPTFVPDAQKAAGGILESALGSAKEGQSKTGQTLGNTLRDLFQKKK